MSESDIPKFELFEALEEPSPVEILGQAGLSQLVAIVPAIEPPESFSFARVHRDVVIRNVFKATRGEVLFLEVSVEGQTQQSLDYITATIANMKKILEIWEQPKDFIELLYSSRRKRRED